jgi:aquaporin rerated protein, other eukaryote
MEEGRVNVKGNIGIRSEYGTERVPYSDNPALTHPSDQFAGLSNGGMHANEYVGKESISMDSGGTPKGPTGVGGLQAGGHTPKTATQLSPLTRSGTYSNDKNRSTARDNTYANKQIGIGA